MQIVDLWINLCVNLGMTESEALAKLLDKMAADAIGLERGQSLASEADRLRAIGNGSWRLGSLRLPLIRN